DAVHDFKSIGSSQTLPYDTTDKDEIQCLMNELADNVARRLQRKQAAERTVQLMLRYHDRKTMTRRKKLTTYIDTKQDRLEIANELLQTHWNLEPFRLLVITLQDVEEKRHIAHQLDLFTYEKEAKMEKLHTVVDNLSQKYGKDLFKNVNRMSS